MCVCEFQPKAAASATSAADLTVTPERRIACSVSDEPNRSLFKERTQNRISAFFPSKGEYHHANKSPDECSKVKL